MPGETEDDLILRRQRHYEEYFNERLRHHLGVLYKRGPGGDLLPIGSIPLDERQEFMLLQEVEKAAILASQGRIPLTPVTERYIGDVAAQNRLRELERKYAQEALSGR